MPWVEFQSMFSENTWKGTVFVSSKHKLFLEDTIDCDENIANILVFIISMLNV